MKICALTMVYRDYWALRQWFRHYSHHLGAENLFVIAHGADPEIARICPGASIITIPRETLKNFDRVRMRLMNAVQSGLNNIYDWVIQTDADELICYDPARYSSFADLLAQANAPALFALGMDLAERPQDAPIPEGDSVFHHRSLACLTGHYSKAWAVSNGLPLRWHGVFCGYKRTGRFPFEMPDGVFLLHLKHANRPALEAGNAVRKSVARTVGESWNVPAWAKADAHAERFFRKLAKADYLPWGDAIQRGYDQIRTAPVRDPDRGIVKAPFIHYICRTDLPDWFATG